MLTVAVPFAYATTTAGESRQLVRGDQVDPKGFEQASIDHLRSIGFLVESEKPARKQADK